MFDVAVVGAGIVGLATAHELSGRGHRVVVLDKEARVSAHQSSRNSGVLHTGVYYTPGSAKARNCREGYRRMLEFCRNEDLPHELCGKVIVATTEDEAARLGDIEARGTANGVALRRLDVDDLRELEPHAIGVAALHVPEAGITSYRAVAERLAERIEERGSELRLGTRVHGIAGTSGGWTVRTSETDVAAAAVVNCAGLQSDRVARMLGADPGVRIVPFRGEYYALVPDAEHLCRGLIYPVPDPAFPFLGVHFTRTIDGGVECGPNAVPALAREGYDWTTVVVADVWESMTDPGFRRLALRHWRTGAGEIWRSLSRAAFARALRRLVPEVRAAHLRRAPAGVRAQALNPDGTLVDDFRIVSEPGMVHVCNAPSPAATSSLAIGDTVAGLVETSISERGG